MNFAVRDTQGEAIGLAGGFEVLGFRVLRQTTLIS